jgi:pterin-4a-carbinolamine dehydratase
MASNLTARQFQAADGARDWRVLAGGASACFRTTGYLQGADFVSRLARLDVVAGHPPDIDVRGSAVTVRTFTAGVGLTPSDLEVARAVSGLAHELGLPPDPAAVQQIKLTIDASDTAAVRPYWAAALGFEPVGDDELADPMRRWPGFWFQQMDVPRPLRNRIHLDIGLPYEHAACRVRAAVAAGGRIVNDEAGEACMVTADPEGNEACLSSFEGRGRPGSVEQTIHTTVGRADWRFTVYDGLRAFFGTPDLATSAAFLAAVAPLTSDDGTEERPHVAFDLRPAGATVRLRTERDDGWGIGAQDADLARGISELAARLGLKAEPARVQAVKVGIDALDLRAVRPFWQAVLGYVVRPDSDVQLVDPADRGPGVWFQEMLPELDPRHEERAAQRNRIHLDVFVPDDEAETRIAAAVAAGGRVVYDAEAPEWWTLADPEGNEVDIAVVPGREEIWLAAQGGSDS